MADRLWTLHRRPRSSRLVVVGEAGALALVPPLWALWHGAWGVLAGMLIALALTVAVHPLGLGVVWIALVLLTWLEGATLRRFALRLAGWEEVGAVLAGSEAGAEEAYLTGKAAGA